MQEFYCTPHFKTKLMPTYWEQGWRLYWTRHHYWVSLVISSYRTHGGSPPATSATCHVVLLHACSRLSLFSFRVATPAFQKPTISSEYTSLAQVPMKSLSETSEWIWVQILVQRSQLCHALASHKRRLTSWVAELASRSSSSEREAQIRNLVRTCTFSVNYFPRCSTTAVQVPTWAISKPPPSPFRRATVVVLSDFLDFVPLGIWVLVASSRQLIDSTLSQVQVKGTNSTWTSWVSSFKCDHSLNRPSRLLHFIPYGCLFGPV